jgi:hypothetical protein
MKPGKLLLQLSRNFVQKGYQELKADLKATGWLRACGGIFFIVWIFGGLLSLVYFAFYFDNDGSFPCQPDGTFSITDTYSPWTLFNLFQVTIGFGTLTFNQAKVIDVTWDVVRFRFRTLLCTSALIKF